MKHHLGIKKILIKVNQGQGVGMISLMSNFLSAKKILVDPGLTVYQLPDGITVELYGAGSSYPPYLFSHGDVIIGYRVSDIRQIVDLLISQGARLLDEIVTICSENCYCFMEVSGDVIIGLYQISSVA